MDGAGGGRRGCPCASDQCCALFPFCFTGNEEFAGRLLSAMRYEFGGHLEKPAGKPGED